MRVFLLIIILTTLASMRPEGMLKVASRESPQRNFQTNGFYSLDF